MDICNNELISVIVPHYKVKKIYTDKCIESICNQSYSNIEIIIIDDGNDFDTSEFLDKYKNFDNRIKVIHQNNQGVSAARNHGIELSHGNWIYFCDPDDYMCDNELEELYNVACKNNSDIVVCGYQTINSNNEIGGGNKVFDNSVVNYEGEDIKLLSLEILVPGYSKLEEKVDMDFIGLVYPWVHLYKKSVISDVRFPLNLHPGEDTLFNLYTLKNAMNVTLTYKALHYYRIEGGVTSTFSKKYLNNSLLRNRLIYDYIERIFKNDFSNSMLSKIEMNQISVLCNNYFFHKDNPAPYSERKEKFKSFLQNNSNNIKGFNSIRYFTTKQKVIYMILRYHAYFVFEIWRMLHK